MARIIEFYVPATFRGRHVRLKSSESRGQVIVFSPRRPARKRYIWLPNGAQWDLSPKVQRAGGSR